MTISLKLCGAEDSCLYRLKGIEYGYSRELSLTKSFKALSRCAVIHIAYRSALVFIT